MFILDLLCFLFLLFVHLCCCCWSCWCFHFICCIKFDSLCLLFAFLFSIWFLILNRALPNWIILMVFHRSLLLSQECIFIVNLNIRKVIIFDNADAHLLWKYVNKKWSIKVAIKMLYFSLSGSTWRQFRLQILGARIWSRRGLS